VAEDTGVMISGITPDSPAEKAGLRVGDIITSIDGEDASSTSDVARVIRGKGEGEIAEVEVIRDKSPLTFSATIEERARSEVDLGEFFLEDCDELEFDFDFDEEAVREAIENATRQFRSPEWRAHWKWVEQWDEEEFNEKLDEKLKELEKKLEKMEKELEKLELKKKSEQY
jgi:C-terminal processing protease CtpA/Prc